MPFNGKRVLALESRRAAETEELIRRNGGDPFVAPSMQEVAIELNEAAYAFAERLLTGGFDMVILMTGVGTRYLARVVETRYPLDQFKDALRGVIVVARGPKPVAAVRELGLQPSLVAPEPNTWREVLAITAGRPERRIAVQEYGRPSVELEEALRARGAEVTAVPVYQWALPDNTGPLEEAARRLADGAFDVAVFTTSQQVVHLMQIAERLGIASATQVGLERTLVASIGPTTSEALREHGIEPAFEASHPKLGILVKEAADRS